MTMSTLTQLRRPLLQSVRPLCRQSRLPPAGTWIVHRRGVATKKEDVVKHLEENEIFKDVLTKFEPKAQLQARFLSSGEEVGFGNEITPLHAQGQPSIEILPFPGEDQLPGDLSGKTGYVVMTDPDAPKRDQPEWSEFCHWIAKVTIPSGKGKEVLHNEKSKQIMEYAGPAPPEDTGKHRYVLVLLQGKDGASPEAPKERKKWGNDEPRTGIRQWAEKNGLEPVAANFFFSKHEPSENKKPEDVHDEKKGLGVGTGAGYGSG